jgi:hypothetical protein
VLTNCPEHVRDMVIMTIWRIWQQRNGILYGKSASPVEAMMDYLDSYYKSLNLAKRYSMEEILKGKMSVDINSLVLPNKIVRIPSKPWPAPILGRILLRESKLLKGDVYGVLVLGKI